MAQPVLPRFLWPGPLATARARGIIADMTRRFVTRPAAGGFNVTDIWTGEVAVIAMTLQTGLSEEDAEHTATLLNSRCERDDRTVAP